MNIYSDSTRESGIATVAIVLIAAVVIGGGVLLATSGDTDSDVDTATDTDAMMEENASTTYSATYSSETGEEVMVEIAADETAQVTLPNGEVKSVSRVRSASGAKYETENGEFVFWNKGEEATVFENDEITFEGTVTEESAAEATSSEEDELSSEVSGSEEAAADEETPEAAPADAGGLQSEETTGVKASSSADVDAELKESTEG